MEFVLLFLGIYIGTYGYFVTHGYQNLSFDLGSLIHAVGSLIHAVTTTCVSAYIIYQTYQEPHMCFDCPLTPDIDRILRFSIAYFYVDIINMVFFKPRILYIIHHLCCLMSMHNILWYYPNLSIPIIYGLCSGECTNPFLLLFTFAKKSNNSELVSTIYPLFTSLFVCMRFVVFPLLSVKVVYHLHFYTQLTIFQKWIYMCPVLIVLIGGFVWGERLLDNYCNYRHTLRRKTK